MTSMPPSGDTSFHRGTWLAMAAAWLAAAFIVPWKLATAHGTETTMVIVMLGAAAVFNSVPIAWPGRFRRCLTRANLGVGFVLAVLTLVGNLLSAAAIARISGPLLAVTLRTEVIAVAVGASLLLGERIDRLFLVGLSIALAGLWLVNQPTAGDTTASPEGVLYGAGAALCFAAIAVLTRKYIHSIDPVAVNALRLCLSFAMALFFGWSTLGMEQCNAPMLLYATLAAVLGPGLGRLCMMFSARDLEARLTSLVVLTSPVWALLLCWLFLDTWPRVQELLGGAVMLLGVGLPLTASVIRKRNS